MFVCFWVFSKPIESSDLLLWRTSRTSLSREGNLVYPITLSALRLPNQWCAQGQGGKVTWWCPAASETSEAKWRRQGHSASFLFLVATRGWCCGRQKAKGEGSDRGWGGRITSLTQWPWTRANFRRWKRTGKPGALRSMGSQRVRHDLAAEQWQGANVLQQLRGYRFNQMNGEDKYSLSIISCVEILHFRPFGCYPKYPKLPLWMWKCVLPVQRNDFHSLCFPYYQQTIKTDSGR